MKTFKDLEFEPRQWGDGIGAHIELGGFVLSVQAGESIYSTPRENLTTADEYSAFEIAVWEAEGEQKWVTRDFIETNDDVAGWVTREEIDRVMFLLQTFKSE